MRPIRRTFRSVTRAPTVDEDLDAELRFHLDMRAAQLAAAGMEPAAARAEALRQFGDLTRVAAECRAIDLQREREMRRFDALDALRQDVRYALRQFRRSPGFTAVAVVLLGLGIGATTAVFSVVSALLLRPLPYADPERLVLLAEYAKGDPTEREGATTSYANFLDWRAQARTFEAMAVVDRWTPALSGAGEAERVQGQLVHPDMFRVLRVRPLLGRLFLPEEAKEGSDVNVVLSYGFWQRRFGGDPGIVGRTITLNARPRLVIGVLPRGFRAPPIADGDLWGNLPFDPRDDCRTCRHLRVLARVKPSATVAQAAEELRTIEARMEVAYPKEIGDQKVAVIPLRERMVGHLKEPLWILLGAAGMVLLIACANLSNLLIARGIARTREFAIRTALGADRARAVRQLLTESVLLATLGGAAGVALALWTTRLLTAVGPDSVRDSQLGLDWRVTTFAVLLTLATGVGFGIAPALRAARADVHAHLKEGMRGSTTGTGARARGALVVSQLAIALTLLVGAGLLIKSFVRLQRVDPGVRTDDVLTMTISLPSQAYPTPESEVAFFTRLIERVQALPGVRGAAVTTNLPLSGNFDRVGFKVEGRQYARNVDEPEAERYVVTPGYFATMGIPLERGRLLTPDDRAGMPHVVVIDDVLARQLWPGESALGKRVTHLGAGDTAVTVVGVVRHVRHYGLDVESGGQLYVPFLDRPSSYVSLAVHTAGGGPQGAATFTPAVRRELKALDPNIPPFAIATMRELVANSTESRRFIMGLLAVFAGVALTIAVVGLYGVIAYTVTQRRHEIGIRVALGAQRGDILRLFVRHGAALAAGGATLGLVAAFGATRVIASLLYGVSATDPLVLAGVPLVLVAVALVASYLPARRAAAVDPMISLRSE